MKDVCNALPYSRSGCLVEMILSKEEEKFKVKRKKKRKRKCPGAVQNAIGAGIGLDLSRQL